MPTAASPPSSGDPPRLFIPFWILSSKNVHCAVVAGHADEGRVLIEVNAAERPEVLGVWAGAPGRSLPHSKQQLQELPLHEQAQRVTARARPSVPQKVLPWGALARPDARDMEELPADLRLPLQATPVRKPASKTGPSWAQAAPVEVGNPGAGAGTSSGRRDPERADTGKHAGHHRAPPPPAAFTKVTCESHF